MEADRKPRSVRPYSAHEWRVALMLSASYILVYVSCARFLPPATELYPAGAIALAALYFGGLRLWPIVLFASALASLIAGDTYQIHVLLPIAAAIQALAGAYLLRSMQLDPLFRRYRDTVLFFGTVMLVSCIVPSFIASAAVLHGSPYTAILFGHGYIAEVCCLIIITPFLLRWGAKLRFSRSFWEIMEILSAFAFLLALAYVFFVADIKTEFGIPILYFLLIPLFWIALRLRPRFVTLALIIIALFAVGGALAQASAIALSERLYSVEATLITLATAFFIIVSLEEDRRVNTNLMRSHLSTLENAIARVSSESKAKNDFIAILAHELRNPLAPVVSAIELMKLKGSYDEEDTEALAMMDDRLRVVRRLLDDLLDISRISEGKIAIKRESVNLEPVIERALLSTEHYRRERHQSLAYHAPSEDLRVLGDPMRIEQIVSNLLTNASKYSDSGDEISVSLREKSGSAEIEVADEGVGISQSALDAIFMPFHQIGQTERVAKGLGIGLALVRNFAEMHGGSVSASSDGAGRGSRFIVRLPLQAGEPVPAKPKPKYRPFLKRARGLNVLIIDDNDAAAAGIGRLMEIQGYSVSYAYDGAQGLQAAATQSPDVILLDIGLPDQDGFAVAMKLREAGFTGRLIALSGYSSADVRERGRAAGFDKFLVKPTGLAELRAALPEVN